MKITDKLNDKVRTSKLITWNVNGIRAVAKKGFLSFIDEQAPDILCVQETKAHPDQVEPELLHPRAMHSFWSSPQLRKGYSGVATFSTQAPQSVEYGIGIRKFDSEGRFVATQFKDFKLYNVYFPNGASGPERHFYKMDFLARFRQHLHAELAQGLALIVVGDYNVAPAAIDVYDPENLATASGFMPEERDWFARFLQIGFTDSFRQLFPNRKESYTWWAYQEGARIANRGWRIDHICISAALVPRLRRCEILDQQMGSDHCPVLMEWSD